MARKKDTLRRAGKGHQSTCPPLRTQSPSIPCAPCPSQLRRENKNTDGEISLEMEKFFGFRPFGQEW